MLYNVSTTGSCQLGNGHSFNVSTTWKFAGAGWGGRHHKGYPTPTDFSPQLRGLLNVPMDIYSAGAIQCTLRHFNSLFQLSMVGGVLRKTTVSLLAPWHEQPGFSFEKLQGRPRRNNAADVCICEQATWNVPYMFLHLKTPAWEGWCYLGAPHTGPPDQMCWGGLPGKRGSGYGWGR